MKMSFIRKDVQDTLEHVHSNQENAIHCRSDDTTCEGTDKVMLMHVNRSRQWRSQALESNK